MTTVTTEQEIADATLMADCTRYLYRMIKGNNAEERSRAAAHFLDALAQRMDDEPGGFFGDLAERFGLPAPPTAAVWAEVVALNADDHDVPGHVRPLHMHGENGTPHAHPNGGLAHWHELP
jgi:hypothetical protein